MILGIKYLTVCYIFLTRVFSFLFNRILCFLEFSITLIKLSKKFLFAFILPCLFLSGCVHSGGVAHPKGIIAFHERSLLYDSVAIMLIVVIPVIIMSFAFAIRYRDVGSNKSKYRPNWSHNTALELVWWGIPTLIIIALGIITWVTSHELDPYESIKGYTNKKPLVIDAISLRWKWVFIYPNQKIATVNTITIPKDRPVEFRLTSIAPMTSFVIPQLGSQVYAMAGMQTKVNLIANKLTQGKPLDGRNNQYNGAGFSWNHFKVNVVTDREFDQWAADTKENHPKTLTTEVLAKLNAQVNMDYDFGTRRYGGVKKDLYRCVIQRYHLPLAENSPFSREYYKNKMLKKWGNSCAYQLYLLEKEYPQKKDYRKVTYH